MNFIIYEDEVEFSNKYVEVIDKLMIKNNINYTKTIINKFDDNTFNIINNISSNKVFIIDIQVPGKNGLDLCRSIRKAGDWFSPMIVVTSHDEFKTVGYTGKILMLDFISKGSNLEKELNDTLRVALEINGSKPSYSFTYKGEYYNIDYSDIIYFEKNLNNDETIIVCENEEYIIRKSISELESELKNTCFFKTHRSCIVNLDKIIKVNYDEGIIYFNDLSIDYLSRSNKKLLKEKLDEYNS